MGGGDIQPKFATNEKNPAMKGGDCKGSRNGLVYENVTEWEVVRGLRYPRRALCFFCGKEVTVTGHPRNLDGNRMRTHKPAATPSDLKES